MPSLCRDCLAPFERPGRCPVCRSPRTLSHPELFELQVAHLDCDAFYASVEKRDNPGLRDQPVIVGGGRRGVVTTCCYIARIRGVRSAMPMFKALRLCPDAVIVKPRFDAYIEASRAIRARMEALTPVVEPLSLDEAYLDLAGTARLHAAPPAIMLARLAAEIERDLGLPVSIGLSHNKFLAKIASDLDKPRGFALIGRAETLAFLAPQPVRLIRGVGEATRAALERAGIHTFADLRRWERRELASRFGSNGDRLWHLARGEDPRRVRANAPIRSISKETTLSHDTADRELLDAHIWRLAEDLSARAKAKEHAGRVVTLKLKRADHSLLTRRQALREPTQLAERIYRAARALFEAVEEVQPFRLVGIGLSELCPAALADASPDLLDAGEAQRMAAERVSDAIRARFGPNAIIRGRSLR